jgi:hypothetical protein
MQSCRICNRRVRLGGSGGRRITHTARARFSDIRFNSNSPIKCCLPVCGMLRYNPLYRGWHLEWQGWILILLTIQPPDLKSHRKVPVLCCPFRKEEVCCGGERTARKIANTTTSSINGAQRVIIPAHPMISSRAKRI